MISKPLLGAIAGIGFSVMGVLFGWALVPPLVRSQIDQKVVLKKGTDQWGRWERLPQAMDFKVFIFNVTNPDAINRGAKPIVKEIGPYVYKQYRHKKVSKISQDLKTIQYVEMMNFVFDKEASAPFTEDDNIVALNMALNSVIQVAEETMASFLGAIDGFLPDVFGINPLDSIFMKTTPRNFLFDGFHFCRNLVGPSEIVCEEIRKKGTKTIHVQNDNSLIFAFFKHKNTTYDGVYEVYSGVEDLSKLTQIVKFDDASTLALWNSTGQESLCNMINGTDSSSYPPHQTGSGPLYIFNSDICRSVHLEFVHKETYKGIEGYKFVTHPDFLRDLGPEYSTECFCVNRIFKGIVKPNGCLYKGALDMTTCLGAPVVVTKPHMIETDPIYTSTVNGQLPDDSKHQIFLNIEPNTGYPLEGKKRIQFNMFLRKVESIKITEKLATSLLPIVWIEEGISLNDEMINMLNSKLFNILMILDVLKYLMILGGIIVFVGCLLWYFHRQKNSSVMIKVNS